MGGGFAGHETTAALLEVALHYLASDQHLQGRIREQVQAREGFDYSAVTGMRGVRNVLNESLRLWPPAPGYFRLARTDQQLAGYRIPAGTSVFILTLAAHRDPEVWGPAATEFDPSRFEADRQRDYPNRFFHPFGVGPRACIGRAFALHEATLLLARILAAYTLSTHQPLKMHERTSLRPVPYQLTVTPRT